METVNALLQLGLCDHCLGRQLGKLATGTSNDERGRTMKLFSAMSDEYGPKITKEDGCGIEENVETGIQDSNSSGSDVNTELISPDQEITEVQPGIDSNLTRFHHEKGETGICVCCTDLFEQIDTFVELVVEAFSDYEFETFLIGSVVDEDIIGSESEIQQRFGLEKFGESVKNELNRVIGLKVWKKIGKEVSFSKPDIVGVVDTRFDSISLQVAPIFLYGRYVKLNRTIPQTIWNCKRCWGKGCEYCDQTGKIYQTSVQEIIGDVILKETGGTRHLFHGMGREDIDARMLGTGRPFILEISNPKKRNLELGRMTRLVNDVAPEKVRISGLHFTEREHVSNIKNMKVDKTYFVEVEFEEEVDAEKLTKIEEEFTGRLISQRTPTRVAHRRSDLVRERKVININCRLEDGRHAAFTIKGESGLYIKELIHGNEGRTQPCVSEFVGTGCKVLSLDVLAVHYIENLEPR